MRILKKYVVQIPKEYKKNLSERWKSDKTFYETRCELCMDYNCCDCPFGKFRRCTDWLEGILPKGIFEMFYESDIPKEFFKVLRERAKQYIEWV